MVDILVVHWNLALSVSKPTNNTKIWYKETETSQVLHMRVFPLVFFNDKKFQILRALWVW
jgi:hypothetical protein